MKLCLQAVVLLAVAFSGGVWAAARGKDKDKPVSVPPIRWEEGKSGCTFSRGDDGKYRYGLWTGDLGITLAVDSQELQKVQRRIRPLFAVQLTVRYRGINSLDVTAEHSTLEFVSHSKVVHSALGPDSLSTALQTDADTLADEIEREVRRRPEQKDDKEARLQAYQKDMSELQEFLSTQSLRPAKLDPGNQEISGWVFFSAKDKWIGAWKKQEELVLRVPLADRVFEFPFKLPPEEGELILRKRP